MLKASRNQLNVSDQTNLIESKVLDGDVKSSLQNLWSRPFRKVTLTSSTSSSFPIQNPISSIKTTFSNQPHNHLPAFSMGLSSSSSLSNESTASSMKKRKEKNARRKGHWEDESSMAIEESVVTSTRSSKLLGRRTFADQDVPPADHKRSN